MRCPNCGADAGDAPFCPQCGADLTASRRRRTQLFSRLDRRLRHFASAVIILIAAISVLLVVMSADDPAEDLIPEPDPAIPSGAVVLSDGYVVLSDRYTEDGFVASVNGDGWLVTYLPADKRVDAVRIVWVWISENDGSSMYITKQIDTETTADEMATLAWMSPSQGTWMITARCYAADGSSVGTRSGSFTYYADSERTYTWTHGGRTLTVTYTASLSAYLDAATYSDGRGTDTLAAAASFVSVDQASELESRIWSAYSSAFGGAHSSSDYASCLLEFVGTCFGSVEDRVLHGTAVYWAYPMETIYLGEGDSGDLAVLAASLLGSAGADRSLIRMPGAWAVGAALISSADPVGGSFQMILSSDGIRYRATTLSPFLGSGLVPDAYGVAGGSVTYYGSVAGDGYGMLVLRD